MAGNVRVDGMSGGNGLIMHNNSGDLSTLALGSDTNQVLLSTGVWGRTVTAPANSWAPTYVEGVAGNYSPPNGSRYFLASTSTTQTILATPPKLYPYMKE